MYFSSVGTQPALCRELVFTSRVEGCEEDVAHGA